MNGGVYSAAQTFMGILKETKNFKVVQLQKLLHELNERPSDHEYLDNIIGKFEQCVQDQCEKERRPTHTH